MLIPLLVFALACAVFHERLAVMLFSSQMHFLAVTAVSFASYSSAAGAVDLNWYAPNATTLNNLSQVIGGEGVNGFIYDSSFTPDNEYGMYNWCNMPHVRATEYQQPSSKYQLQYVEVVGSMAFPGFQTNAHCLSRSIDITNEPCTPRTPSPSSPMVGIAAMKNFSTMDSQRLARNLRTHTGRATSLQPIPLDLLGLSEHANSHRSLQGASRTLGNMGKIFTGCITICLDSYLTVWRGSRSGSHITSSLARLRVWLSMACLTRNLMFQF